MTFIHRDLLAIIFAYGGITQHREFPLALISRNTRKICRSYHYVISLSQRDVGDLFQYACQYGRLKLVNLCLKNPRFVPRGDEGNFYSGISLASLGGHLEIVRQLLLDTRINPRGWDKRPIEFAARNKHSEVLKLLLAAQRTYQSSWRDLPFKEACEKGDIEIIRIFLADVRTNPACLNNRPIQYASANGHLEIVRLLLANPRVDPSGDFNLAIRWAVTKGHLNVAMLLLTDMRVNPADSRYHTDSTISCAFENRHLDIVKFLLTQPRVVSSLTSKQLAFYQSQV